ncbi:MAG: response regulator [Bacteroidales bacterium]|nr:response regulator [Bacteroidales bacterium]
MSPVSKKFQFLLCVVGFLGISNFSVFAKEKAVQFEYLTTDNGLSHQTVATIVQDSTGFMWFGTRNGLNRYDGYTFKIYNSDKKDSVSIPGDRIEDLLIDSKGNLWIAHNRGYSIYNRELDNFINYSGVSNDEIQARSIGVSKIFEDKKGRIWLGVYQYGLCLLGSDNNIVNVFSHLSQGPNVISDNTIYAIEQDRRGYIWLATNGGGLDRFNPVTGKFKHFDIDPEGADHESPIICRDLVKDAKGNIWVGSYSDRLYRISIRNTGEVNFIRYNLQTNIPQPRNILSLCSDGQGGFWIGTENEGLSYFNISNLKTQNYRFDENIPGSLNSNSVHSIYIDKANNLWVGTYTGGINVYKSNRKNIETYKKIHGNQNSLSYNVVSCFYMDFDGKLWIGTDGGGINVLDRKTGKYKHYTTKNSNLIGDAVLDIGSDRDGNIWVSGWGTGLNRYNRNTGSFTLLSEINEGVSNHNIFATYVDSKSRIWVSFASVGLSQYDSQEKRFITYSTKNSGIPNDWVIDIKEDYKGNIILAHVGGFSVFNTETKRFKNYTESEEDGLSDGHCQVLLQARDSSIWIGTINGLNVFDPVTEKFAHYFEEDGLANNRITSLVEDMQGNIWIGTDNGISKFNPKDTSFYNLRYTDGLQGKSFIRRSSCITKNGQLLFGGTKGFNIFHPDSLGGNTIPPDVVITGFSVFNEPVLINAEKGILTKDINECDKITLNYNHTVISFEFAALDYTTPEQNQYAYMLEGFDKGWNYVKNKRTATYTNLDPGTYNLRIIASNNDGVWNYEGKSLLVIIKPPFWKTFWFIALISILVFGISYHLIRERIKSYNYQQQLLAKKVKERTCELQEANLLLEEKQEKINIQNEAIKEQHKKLEEKNARLLLQREQILAQNKELDKHRNKLEHLVEQRTKELEKALYKAEQSDRLKSAFLANMSHEIRTPMNAIIGFASLLRDEDVDDKSREQFINFITSNGETLLVLINDILELSKLQADQITLNYSTVNIHNLFREITSGWQFEASRKKLKLKLSMSKISQSLNVYADKERLKQVINNLAANAIKFTDNGFIELGGDIKDNLITFYVKDTGIGVPKESGDDIFDRFRKSENSNDLFYSGTGLGLAICKNLVGLWDGEIWYESELNKGTTFYFTLPVLKIPETDERSETHKWSSEYPDMKNKVILIAEDEDTNFDLLNIYLLKTSAKIIRALDGKEAISKFDQFNPDIILMDIKLPVMSGFQATKIIRQSNPNVPIIAQTAYAFADEVRMIKESGINDILVKPISTVQLAKVLNKYFR